MLNVSYLFFSFHLLRLAEAAGFTLLAGDTKSPSFASFRRVGRFIRPFYTVEFEAKKKQQRKNIYMKSKEKPSDVRVWMCFLSKSRLEKSKYFNETSARVDGSDFTKLVEFAIMQKFAGIM